MKPYKKPVIISEQIFERTALSCEDYMYYVRDYEGCRDEFFGRGKDDMHSCYAGLYS